MIILIDQLEDSILTRDQSEAYLERGHGDQRFTCPDGKWISFRSLILIMLLLLLWWRLLELMLLLLFCWYRFLLSLWLLGLGWLSLGLSYLVLLLILVTLLL